MAPYDLVNTIGQTGTYLLFLMIGVGFGAVLEMSGFGDSRKLAAQFYFKDMTVLKVMFTAIVVAAVLLFGATAVGWLDFNRVWVNETYLVPGIVGGLIMGVGFIIGGFCPGTSIVAASTLKIDGMLFVLGVFLGVHAFGETVPSFMDFYNSSFMGRFMLPELLGLPTGVTVLLLVFMALAMFWAAELSEEHFGQGTAGRALRLMPRAPLKIGGAAILVVLTLSGIVLGEPTAQEKWHQLAEKEGISMENRDVYVHPAEVVDWMEDSAVVVRILDVRSQSDFNLFHVYGAERLAPEDAEDPTFIRQLTSVPDNTLYFVVSNGESSATEAFIVLRAAGVKNVYVIDGGYNHWLTVYPTDPCIAVPATKPPKHDEALRFTFLKAVGHSCYSAHPRSPLKEPPTDCFLKNNPHLRNVPKEKIDRPNPMADRPTPGYQKKVKLEKKSAVKGGCG
jgi:hypothetical protein